MELWSNAAWLCVLLCISVRVCVCVYGCVLGSVPAILSPLLERAQSIPPVCRCHGWTSSFAYICMLSNGAAADSFQCRLSSWTLAQSCRHGYAALQKAVRQARGQTDRPRREWAVAQRTTTPTTSKRQRVKAGWISWHAETHLRKKQILIVLHAQSSHAEVEWCRMNKCTNRRS